MIDIERERIRGCGCGCGCGRELRDEGSLTGVMDFAFHIMRT